MRFILAFAIFLIPAFSYAKVDDILSRVEKFWFNRDAESAFNEIVTSFDKGEEINVLKLTELTGARKIQKLLDGSGDESAQFLGNKFIAIYKYTGWLRFYDIKKKECINISGDAYPIADLKGLVFRDNRWVYFYRKHGNNLVINEFDLVSRTMKPLCELSEKNVYFLTDDECSVLQVVNKNDKVICTIDLIEDKKIQREKISSRLKAFPTRIKAKTGKDKIVFSIDGETIEMEYPAREFLEGGINDKSEFYSDKNNPKAFFVESLWYPGLHLLFDLGKQKVYKIYLPEWLSPIVNGVEPTVSWKQIGNNILFWCENFRFRDKNGLYMIDLRNLPSAPDFVQLLLDLNLAHRESKVGKSNHA